MVISGLAKAAKTRLMVNMKTWYGLRKHDTLAGHIMAAGKKWLVHLCVGTSCSEQRQMISSTTSFICFHRFKRLVELGTLSEMFFTHIILSLVMLPSFVTDMVENACILAIEHFCQFNYKTIKHSLSQCRISGDILQQLVLKAIPQFNVDLMILLGVPRLISTGEARCTPFVLQ